MSSQECNKCFKTVYVTEKVEIGQGKWIHKSCFKCSDPSCVISLNLKNFKVAENQVWCNKHEPKHNAQFQSIGVDSLSQQHLLNSPKKQSEGLHKVQLGTGETPTYGLDSLPLQFALCV